MAPTAQTITLTTPDGEMLTYDAEPAAAPTAGVIVIQEAFGVNAHIEDVTRRFADAGYRAVAPHLFHRTGDPELAYDDYEAMWPHLKALTADGITADVDACITYLEENGLASARIGIVGFCMGGSVTALAAERRRLGAGVSFYGGGVTEGRFGMPPLVELAPSFQTPWLGLYGGQDEGIPLDQAEALRDAAVTATVPTELVIYPEAGHGFHCDQRPKNYNEEAARDAWTRTLEWFAEHLAQDR